MTNQLLKDALLALEMDPRDDTPHTQQKRADFRRNTRRALRKVLGTPDLAVFQSLPGCQHLLPEDYSEGDGAAGYWYQIGDGHVLHVGTPAIGRYIASISK